MVIFSIVSPSQKWKNQPNHKNYGVIAFKKKKKIKIQNQRWQCEENIVCGKFYLFGDNVKFLFLCLPFYGVLTVSLKIPLFYWGNLLGSLMWETTVSSPRILLKLQHCHVPDLLWATLSIQHCRTCDRGAIRTRSISCSLGSLHVAGHSFGPV